MKVDEIPEKLAKKESELRYAFLEQVKAIPGGEKIKACIQCGTCTGSCPVSYTMDISPRELIALFRAGDMATIMNSRTIWICASCYSCQTRCPSGIKITDIVYALKRTAMEKNYLSGKAKHVQILANLFIQNLMSYGRLHEGTLIRKFYTKTSIGKLFKMIPLGRIMYKKNRVAILPKKIKAYESLSKIIKRAQEIELRIAKERLKYSPEFVGYKGLGEMQLESRKGE
ncbi:MAG: 4Fe-4S dicluster domain-containing protein [Ignavibacteria bacterium]|nr:4Fe-4S dicluster domain-containing protein [Ignavibacteria bacterium]